MNIYGYFCASLYNYDLQSQGNIQIDHFSTAIPDTHDGVFLKSFYLYVQYIAFIYYTDSNHFKLNILEIDKQSSYSYTLISQFSFEDNDLPLSSDITMNEFLKVDSNRLILITTQDYTTLYIIIFNLFTNIYKIKARYYQFSKSKNIYIRQRNLRIYI